MRLVTLHKRFLCSIWVSVLFYFNFSADPKNYELPALMITPIFKHFPGYMACLIFGILFAILMPMIGIFFCCLRCCGRCGGRVTQMDRKGDPYRRVCYTITLAMITTVQLASIVLAFINYQLHYDAILSKDISVGMAPQIIQSSDQFQIAITEIVNAAKNSSSVNLEVQKKNFDAVFDAGLTDFQNDFVNNSSAAEVLRAKDALQQVAYKFGVDSLAAAELRNFFDSLERTSVDLPMIRSTISDILNSECTLDQLTVCRELRFTTDNDLEVAYTLDEFQSTQVGRLLDILESSQQEVTNLNAFNKTLVGMKDDVKKAIQPILDDAWSDLSNSPKTREDLVRSIEQAADTAKSYLVGLNDFITTYLSADSQYISKGSDFFLYSGIAFLCLPVLVILLVYLGLCFGACGNRPYEEASVCNRGVGANLLMSGVVFTFLLSTILMLVCTVVFLTGGLAQTEVCRYATGRYPEGPAVLDDVLDTISVEAARQFGNSSNTVRSADFHAITKSRPFSVLLTKCANASLVDAIGDEVVGMMVSDTSINTFLENILTTFNGIDLISPLRKAATDTLNVLDTVSDLRNFNLSRAIAKTNDRLTKIVDFDAYMAQLRSLNIDNLKSQIDALQTSVGMLSLRLEVIKQVYVELDSIRTYYLQLVRALNEFSADLEQTVPSSIRTQIHNTRPLFLKELRFAVIASWRHIPCTNLHLAAKAGVT
uniref:Prominin-1-A-like n=1 Tax=Mesocestoides corti TaxID=53468 RepID=A0A5K3FR57_MESCO